MGLKVCIEAGCFLPTWGTRCEEHERAWQRRRNDRRGAVRGRRAAFRKVGVAGLACVCCGTTDDMTRHHITPTRLDPAAELGQVVPMCRRCNSSIGARVMEDHRCPMHGGPGC